MQTNAHGRTAAGSGDRTTLSIGEGEGAFHVSFTPGIERFIGVYPRLDGLCPAGKLLKFNRAPARS